jgi:hypothetical protein
MNKNELALRLARRSRKSRADAADSLDALIYKLMKDTGKMKSKIPPRTPSAAVAPEKKP